MPGAGSVLGIDGGRRLAESLVAQRAVDGLGATSEDAFVVEAGRSEVLRGVWVLGRKLGSIGMAVHNLVTYHGFAHNVSTDLSYFDRIRPCGNEGRVMTSMEKELGRPVEVAAFKARVARDFEAIFRLPLETIPAAVLVSAAFALSRP